MKLCLIIINSFLLLSCGLLGPDYQKPQVNAPQSWNSQDSKAYSATIDISELSWWKKFNDPQLNSLIESALANNNSIQSAIGNVLQAQAALKSVQMAWVPTIFAGGSQYQGQLINSYVNIPNANSSTNNFANNSISGTQNFSGYDVGFVPNYTLNVFSQIKQDEIAKLSLFAQQEAQNAIRLAVISQVAASYLSLLGFKQQLVLQQQLLSNMQELLRYNQIQYDNGSISIVNVTDIEQHIASTKAAIPITQHNITQVSNALQALTNNNPGKIKTVKSFDAISTNGIVPVNLPSTVLKSRPDVAMAEYQLQINNANIGLMTSQFFPTINLTGMAGNASFQLINLFQGDFWVSQLSAGIPILNLAMYADIDKAKGGYYSAYYNYIGTVKNAFSQVDTSLSQHDALNKSYDLQLQALQKSKYLYQLSKNQYENGAISLPNTLYSKLNVDEYLLVTNNTKMQQVNSIVNLYQVLGGGYNAESNLTQVKKFNNSHDI